MNARVRVQNLLVQKEMEVSRDDQVKINQFSRLNGKYHEIEMEMKAKKVMDVESLIQEEVEALEDAGNLIEEALGEGVLLHIGECFVEVNDDYAKSYHNTLIEKTKKELDTLNESKGDIEKQMKELRAHLYARFGVNINLEEEA